MCRIGLESVQVSHHPLCCMYLEECNPSCSNIITTLLPAILFGKPVELVFLRDQKCCLSFWPSVMTLTSLCPLYNFKTITKQWWCERKGSNASPPRYHVQSVTEWDGGCSGFTAFQLFKNRLRHLQKCGVSFPSHLGNCHSSHHRQR